MPGRPVSAMQTAHICSAQCTGISIGGAEVILSRVAYILVGMNLDIRWAHDGANSWVVVVTILLGIGVLTFSGYA